MATKVKGITTVTEQTTGFDAADLEQRVKHIPEIFAGLTSEQLLSQVPTLKAKAKAHKAGEVLETHLSQLKGVTRAYRRMVGDLAGIDRVEPSAVVPMLQRLEGIFVAAEAVGLNRHELVDQADALTQKLVGMMAVVGLLV